MKKLLTIIFFLVAGVSYAQPGCPTGQQNQLAKWKFLFSQCFDDSVFLKYAATKQVAFIDANGTLTTIPFLQLRDSLSIPQVDGNQWNIQFNDSGEFSSSVDFNYDADEGVFYVNDFNGDTLFSVNTQTREIRQWGTISARNLADSSLIYSQVGSILATDSNGLAWDGSALIIGDKLRNPFKLTGEISIYSTSGTTDGRISVSMTNNIGANGPALFFARSRGTSTTPTAPQNGSELGKIEFGGYNGAAWQTTFTGIRGISGGTWAGTSTPVYMGLFTRDANNVLYQSTLTQKGGLSIKGTNADSLADLTINGTSLTGTQDFNSIRILQTWNTTGNPTGIFANYTNTASGATSKLIDLQTDGTTRFNVLKTGEATFSSLINATAYIATTSGNGFIISGGGRLKAPDGNGIFELTNTTENGFNRINFGDNTSSFPSLKRNGAGLQVRTGDDSGFGTLEAGNTTINSVLTLTPITATAASAITPAFGMMVVVNNTNGTFTSTGLWFYNGAAWVFIIG